MSTGLIGSTGSLPPQGLIAFPGILQVVDWTFTLSHGVRPNSAAITITPQNAIDSLDGTMSISYGDVQIDFPDARIDAGKFECNEQSQVVQLTIMDRRWKWQFPVISGVYNQWSESTRISDQQGDGMPSELMPGTEKTPQELCELCLEAMGEEDFDISLVPNDARPTVEWDYANAADSLSQVADAVGCRVILRLDNTVQVAPEGMGAQIPQRSDSQAQDVSVDPPDIPDKVVCVSSRTRYNFDYTLEAVGEEKTGAVKPIGQLSYKPEAGWGSIDLDTFLGVKDPTCRDIAKNSVFRWYRILCMKSWGDLDELDFDDFDPNINEAQNLLLRCILPINDTQIFQVWADIDTAAESSDNEGEGDDEWDDEDEEDEEADSGDDDDDDDSDDDDDDQQDDDDSDDDEDSDGGDDEEEGGETVATGSEDTSAPLFNSKPAQVWGLFYAAIKDKNTRAANTHTKLKPIPYAPFDEEDDYAKSVLFTGPFEIDAAHGIVKFQEPMYMLEKGSQWGPAKLILRTSTCVRDDETNAYVRHELSQKVPNDNPSGTEPQYLMHDELVAKVYPVYDDDYSIKAIKNNYKDNNGGSGIDAYGAFYIAAQIAKYQVDAPQTVIFASIVAVDLDGAIQQITWSGGPSGATTRVSRNNETSPHVQTYDEMRLASLSRLAAKNARKGPAQLANDQKYKPRT